MVDDSGEAAYNEVMRLHVVDGTFELYRAHFSPRPGHVTSRGVDLKATTGVIGSLMTLLADAQEAVTHLAVAFDNPIRSFRNELFDGYKTDDRVPPTLRAQFDLVETAVQAMGAVVWSMNRWEADDAMATAAARFGGEEVSVRLLSPDKDLGQCLRPGVVQVDRIRRRVIDHQAFRERWGIEPRSMPDYLALVGDSADGIPGLPGFGAKSTATLLSHYRQLEAIPDDPSEWAIEARSKARLAKTLAERRTDAELYRRLATLIEDVPLEESLEDLRFAGPPSRTEWRAQCEAVEMPQWIARYESLLRA